MAPRTIREGPNASRGAAQFLKINLSFDREFSAMNWSAVAAVGLGLGVILGAFGAHGLRNRLDAYSLDIYERAVFHHFVHALGLLIVSVLPKFGLLSPTAGSWVCGLLLAGIVIFSGSLYALAVTGIRGLGAITPIGGTAFIAAWFLLAVALLRGVRPR
jgi:uncharacterized membrane protein YgdD (TMEM256/DUF423 family)